MSFLPGRRRRWIPIALLLLALGLVAPAAAQETPNRVVVHLGHYTDDLHTASMALGLANLLQQQGASVTLFLDREGVRLADPGTPQNLRWAEDAPISERYATFVDAGGRVVVCAHCASAAGLTAGSLRQGARLGTDESVAELFLEADRVIDF